jgi:hypothetical protein
VRHALYRLGDKSAKPLNWHKWGYCMGVVALMIRPGRHHETLWHEGVMLRGDYYWTRPEATAHAFLAEIGLGCPDAITESALATLEDGLAAAKRRKATSFMRADTMAEILNVDRAERERLRLWHIGATDYPKAERQAAAKATKRENDRARDERKRRAAGARPRARYESESFTRVQPWLYFDETRTAFYERPKDERDAMLVEAIRLRENGEKPERNARTSPSHPASSYGLARHLSGESPPVSSGPSRHGGSLKAAAALSHAATKAALHASIKAEGSRRCYLGEGGRFYHGWTRRTKDIHHPAAATSAPYAWPVDAKRHSSGDPNIARPQVLTPSREGRAASVLWQSHRSRPVAACFPMLFWQGPAVGMVG